MVASLVAQCRVQHVLTRSGSYVGRDRKISAVDIELVAWIEAEGVRLAGRKVHVRDPDALPFDNDQLGGNQKLGQRLVTVEGFAATTVAFSGPRKLIHCFEFPGSELSCTGPDFGTISADCAASGSANSPHKPAAANC